MKRICFILLIAISWACTGCRSYNGLKANAISTGDVIDAGALKNFIVYHFDYNGHSYLSFTTFDNSRTCIIHDPDCPCGKIKTNSNWFEMHLPHNGISNNANNIEEGK